MLEGFIQGVSTKIGTDTKDAAALDTAARWMRANNYDLSGLPFSTVKATAHERTRIALRQRWSELWMIPEFPENADRFAIDYDAAVAIATRMTGHDKLGTKQ